MTSINAPSVQKGIKAFPKRSASGYPGSFHLGFLEWVQESGFWGDKRIYLCCGGVVDEAADKVDIQAHIDEEVMGRRGLNANMMRSRTTTTTANIIADARNTKLPPESYDWVMIDPPYTSHLAETMYGTEAVFSGVDEFVKEGFRLCRPGGLICILHYHIPKEPIGSDLVAVWGIYQVPQTRFLSAFTVFQKHGKRRSQGLQLWTE